MLETVKVGDGSGDVADVPCVASLHFTKSLDDCNSVGMAFIKQVVFLGCARALRSQTLGKGD